MTEREAIEVLKRLVLCGTCTTGPCEDCERKQAKDMALSALEEIQKYRAIGTVEECREAMERQRNKKVVESDDDLIGYDDDGNPVWETEYACTECGREIVGEYVFCPYCGQALDWKK